MKNLKRTLSLVLALVLAVGLLTVGAGAAFKDDAQITYKEAVDLLTGLGVINGYPEDNSFRPTETFNRAGLAKMVAYFSWGGKDLSNYYTGLNIFADYGDSSTNWAKGSINYGYNAGYIAGAGVDKDNKLVYNPTGTVKGSELAKTLLCVLGYNPKSSNVLYALEGANWELNSIRLAQQEGLYNGLKAGFDPTAPLTREEAAQIFMNALTARMVKDYKEDGSPKEFYPTDGVGSQIMLVNTFKYEKDAEQNSKDAFGRPIITYTNTIDGSKVIKIAAKPVLTSTTVVSAAELYNKLGYNAVLDASKSAYTAKTTTTGKFLNAALTEESTTYSVSAMNKSIGGNGIITEIYKLDNAGNFAVVQLRPTLTTVTSVTNVKATPTKGAYTRYVIDGLNCDVYTSVVNSAMDKDNVVLTGAIAKGDNVLIYGNATGGYTVSPATLVTGKLTGYSSANGYAIAGNNYKLSAAANAAEPTSYNTDATYAIDAYGYVVKSVTLTVPSNYIYVLEAGAMASYLNSTTNRIESILEASALTVDGSVVKLQIAKLAKTKGNLDPANDSSNNVEAGLYTYKLDSNGKYELTAVSADDNAKDTYFEVTGTLNKSPELVAGSKYADNNTKYFVATQNAETKAWSVTSYVGYATTAISGGSARVAIDSNKNNVAEIVFVNGGSAAGASAEYVYVTGSYTSDGSKFTYEVIVNGATEQMVLTNENIVTRGLYTVEDGKASAVKFGSEDTADVELKLDAGKATDGIYGKTEKFFTYSNGLLMKSKDDETYTYLATIGDTVPVYTFENGAVSTGTAADLSATNGTMIVIAANAAGNAIGAIYIVK